MPLRKFPPLSSLQTITLRFSNDDDLCGAYPPTVHQLWAHDDHDNDDDHEDHDDQDNDNDDDLCLGYSPTVHQLWARSR